MGCPTPMWRSGWCSERRELRRRRLQSINVISTRPLTRFSLITWSVFLLYWSILQQFEFEVPWEQIRDCSLDIAVMDFDTIGRNELIGRLQLGCKIESRSEKGDDNLRHCSGRNSSGHQETKQWQDMIANPRQSAVVWHRSVSEGGMPRMKDCSHQSISQ